MSFLTPLALLVGALIVLPVLAHALRKGKAAPRAFPASRLVPTRSATAKKRSRIEDRGLLLLRALLVLALALLAASPLVQCSRLSLGRTDGASVSAALIIDNSASMRAQNDADSTRLSKAIEAATQLVQSSQSGDAFSLILAGAPARILTPTTTDRSSVLDALSQIRPGDRSTDLEGALSLARGLQADSPQQERPIVLLSDLAVPSLDRLNLKDIVVPEAGLRGPLQNCAIIQATRVAESIQVEIACTSAEAMSDRWVELVAGEDPVGKPVPVKDGLIAITLFAEKTNLETQELRVRLTRPARPKDDQIESDDGSPVLDATARLTVGVRADQGTAGLKTGAGTVVQAGIEALDRGVRVETLSLLPDQAQDLSPYAALLIDDPSGFTPEVRDALETWMKSGGVGLVFLGPNVRRAPLGSGFLPFLVGAPRWESTSSRGTSPERPGSLGPLSTTWSDLGAASRVFLEDEPEAQVLAAWDDGHPFLLEKRLGRGLALSVTLPSSVDQSDLALRPAFLELLDHAISESALRKGAQATKVGERWHVGENARVVAPDGRVLEKHKLSLGNDETQAYVEPDLSGPYEITDEQGRTMRYAMRHAVEHVTQSPQSIEEQGVVPESFQLSEVGISREVALLVLCLSLLELVFRVLRRPQQADLPPKSTVPPPESTVAPPKTA